MDSESNAPPDSSSTGGSSEVQVHTESDPWPPESALDPAELQAGNLEPWHFNTEMSPVFGVTLILRGFLNLSTHEIDAAFSAKIPFLGSFVLTHVKGSLARDIAVGFDISILAGKAVYYERDGWLWVSLSVTVYGQPHGPLAIRLFFIPENFKVHQSGTRWWPWGNE
ncbi:hypothetical protein C8F01DRAFT_1146985 [Mycena amicta]|nr:hypothetical protein C8F01DRAFT_1146985 [Mycena amicta]